ncbi:uncharacterized protein O9250_000032 [Rhynochetos jubatus]
MERENKTDTGKEEDSPQNGELRRLAKPPFHTSTAPETGSKLDSAGAETADRAPVKSAAATGVVSGLQADLENLSSAERITVLQEKLQEVRKRYLCLKSEVASIDRRRKLLKRKERETNRGPKIINQEKPFLPVVRYFTPALLVCVVNALPLACCRCIIFLLLTFLQFQYGCGYVNFSRTVYVKFIPEWNVS